MSNLESAYGIYSDLTLRELAQDFQRTFDASLGSLELYKDTMTDEDLAVLLAIACRVSEMVKEGDFTDGE